MSAIPPKSKTKKLLNQTHLMKIKSPEISTIHPASIICILSSYLVIALNVEMLLYKYDLVNLVHEPLLYIANQQALVICSLSKTHKKNI